MTDFTEHDAACLRNAQSDANNAQWLDDAPLNLNDYTRRRPRITQAHAIGFCIGAALVNLIWTFAVWIRG
jgi:hypothetical protein